MKKLKYGPRVNTITKEPMFEGYCICDGEAYCQTAEELFGIMEQDYNQIRIEGVSDGEWMERLYDLGFYYYTEWSSLPIDEWDVPPTLMDVVQDVMEWMEQNADEAWSDIEDDETTPVVYYEELRGFLYEVIARFNLKPYRA